MLLVFYSLLLLFTSLKPLINKAMQSGIGIFTGIEWELEIWGMKIHVED